MGQGMVTYRTLLSAAIDEAPPSLSPLEVVRHTVRQVAAAAGSTGSPRVRQIIQIASRSVAAREAQLSRRADLENVVARAFAVRCRIPARDEITPRVLLGLTLTILDVTFRAWARDHDAEIGAIADDVFATLTGLVADGAGPAPQARRPRVLRKN
jgi:hypothetical protein